MCPKKNSVIIIKFVVLLVFIENIHIKFLTLKIITYTLPGSEGLSILAAKELEILNSNLKCEFQSECHICIDFKLIGQEKNEIFAL